MAPEEFDRFYRDCVARLVRQLYALLGDAADAQDVVQEAFVRAWARRRRLTEVDDPEAWVRTVAWRLGISRLRRLRTARAWRERQRLPEGAAPPSPDHVALVEALRRLPAAQRRALVLFYLADRTVAQVAAETGVPEGTVKARLSRGRTALAALLHDPAADLPSRPPTDRMTPPVTVAADSHPTDHPTEVRDARP